MLRGVEAAREDILGDLTYRQSITLSMDRHPLGAMSENAYGKLLERMRSFPTTTELISSHLIMTCPAILRCYADTLLKVFLRTR